MARYQDTDATGRTMPPSESNRLLRGLPRHEWALLEPHFEEITLDRGSVLTEAGSSPASVYFPITAVLSLVGATETGATVEVAIVGREGMASVSAVLGNSRLPFKVLAQVEGAALRAPTELIRRHLHECGELHDRLLGYSQNVIIQIGQSAICNRFHNARQRLARWLLMTADRADTRALPLTHEFISAMVGGPRSAVTEAAAALRDSGAIDYKRGFVTINDIARLRQEACECYAAVSEAVARSS